MRNGKAEGSNREYRNKMINETTNEVSYQVRDVS